MQKTNGEIYKEKIIIRMSYMSIPGLKLDGYKFITDIVCKEFRVSKDDVFRRSRIRRYVFARHVMMYLAQFSFKTQTLTEIGDGFGGYNHATVLHAKRAVNDIVSYDKLMHEKVMKLLEQTAAVKKRFLQETKENRKSTLLV